MGERRTIVNGQDVTEYARLLAAGQFRIVPRDDSPESRTLAESVRAEIERMAAETLSRGK